MALQVYDFPLCCGMKVLAGFYTGDLSMYPKEAPPPERLYFKAEDRENFSDELCRTILKMPQNGRKCLLGTRARAEDWTREAYHTLDGSRWTPPPPAHNPLIAYRRDARAEVRRKATSKHLSYTGLVVVALNVYQVYSFEDILLEEGFVKGPTSGNPNHGSWTTGRTVTLYTKNLQPDPKESAKDVPVPSNPRTSILSRGA